MGQYAKNNKGEPLKNTDHFIHEFVRIRDKISVPEAAKRMGVAAATWRLWEAGTTGMSHTRWPHFNATFGTTLSPDNVKNGGPASEADMAAYCDLKDNPPKPKVSKRVPVRVLNAVRACKTLRNALSLSSYEAAVMVGTTLKFWQSWEAGRSVPSRRKMDRIRAHLPDNVDVDPAVTTTDNLETTNA